MEINNKPTSPLQMFHEFVIIFEVIFINVKTPDDVILQELLRMHGLGISEAHIERAFFLA